MSSFTYSGRELLGSSRTCQNHADMDTDGCGKRRSPSKTELQCGEGENDAGIDIVISSIDGH